MEVMEGDGQSVPAADEPARTGSPARLYKRRRGRPSRARGQAHSSDAASARWTIRGVPQPVRDMALRAAEARGMTVGDWVAEAIVSVTRAAERAAGPHSNLPTTEAPPDLTRTIQALDERLTRLEASQQRRGFFGRLLGRRS